MYIYVYVYKNVTYLYVRAYDILNAHDYTCHYVNVYI